MPAIKVDQPFSLRVNSKSQVREFGRGIHKISEAELGHWFMQGCLKEGRAALLADEPVEMKGVTNKADEKENTTEAAQDPAPETVTVEQSSEAAPARSKGKKA